MQLIIVTLLVLLVGISGNAQAVEKKCEFCHTGHSGEQVLLIRDINGLCSGCHDERLKKGEHAVGMSPSMTVSDLPLHSGKMTCATCHDPHSRTPRMLRKQTAELCLSCHLK